MTKNSSLVDKLSVFGLKEIEAELYIKLLELGALSASELGIELNITKNNVYRYAKVLAFKGLIVSLDVVPKKFQSVQPGKAISDLANKNIVAIEESGLLLANELSKVGDKKQQSMQILTGQKALLEIYSDLAMHADNEILVISVGEPVPDEVWASTEVAISKGIKPKFIFHQNNKDNYFLIKKWLALGVEVRHQLLAGYHLYIFDESSAVLSASNPQQTTERTGVLIQNDAIVSALRTYFFQQWELSKPV